MVRLNFSHEPICFTVHLTWINVSSHKQVRAASPFFSNARIPLFLKVAMARCTCAILVLKHIFLEDAGRVCFALNQLTPRRDRLLGATMTASPKIMVGLLVQRRLLRRDVRVPKSPEVV